VFFAASYVKSMHVQSPIRPNIVRKMVHKIGPCCY